jgi:hypothetical protein
MLVLEQATVPALGLPTAVADCASKQSEGAMGPGALAPVSQHRWSVESTVVNATEAPETGWLESAVKSVMSHKVSGGLVSKAAVRSEQRKRGARQARVSESGRGLDAFFEAHEEGALPHTNIPTCGCRGD